MYIVRKRIKKRYYLYEQETYRVGKKVKTRNKYIGPAQSIGAMGAAPVEPRSGASIQHELDEAVALCAVLKEVLANHPAKFFVNLRKQLPNQSIGGDSFAELNYVAMDTPYQGRSKRLKDAYETFKHLDGYLSEYGYANFDELDESAEEYAATKQQLRSAYARLKTLRLEQKTAAAYHRAIGWGGTRESVIKPVPEPKPRLPRTKQRTFANHSPPKLNPTRRRWHVRFKLRRFLKAPRRYFNELVPNVGRATTADRYVESHKGDAPAAPAGKADKAE